MLFVEIFLFHYILVRQCPVAYFIISQVVFWHFYHLNSSFRWQEKVCVCACATSPVLNRSARAHVCTTSNWDQFFSLVVVPFFSFFASCFDVRTQPLLVFIIDRSSTKLNLKSIEVRWDSNAKMSLNSHQTNSDISLICSSPTKCLLSNVSSKLLSTYLNLVVYHFWTLVLFYSVTLFYAKSRSKWSDFLSWQTVWS